MRRWTPFFSLILAGTTAAVLAGCRDTTPSTAIAGPTTVSTGLDRSNQPHDNGNVGSPGASSLLVCSVHDSASVSAWVGPSGASIRVGNVHLIIPGNALSDSVLITATIPADTLADIQFEPHGLQFGKDVILVLSTEGCATGGGAPAHVDYLDGTGQVLETLDGTFNGGSHTVTTKIHHFSSYAIAL